MSGDAKQDGGSGGLWKLGRWFSPSGPQISLSTQPSPPPDILSSPSSAELYPPAAPQPQPEQAQQSSSPYTTSAPQPPSPAYSNNNTNASPVPQEEAERLLYPPVAPHGGQNSNSALSGEAHGLGRSFHQVADPTGGYVQYGPTSGRYDSGEFDFRFRDSFL